MAKYDAYEDKEDVDALRKELASTVLDGLTGDALTAAMDIGREKVVAKDGIPTLVQKIKESLKGKKVLEMKDLYKEGGKSHGPMSRQKGEPMSSYTSMRRRWYNRLITIDETSKLPERLLVDMLLEHSGLTNDQRLMVTTAIGSSNNDF